jgi:predicted  nucleic acid-binding Zn-ribbon protein
MAKTALKNDSPETVAIKAPAKKSPSSEQGNKSDFSVEAKLSALFELQSIDSTIDKIRIVRGELPVEVSDLEDEVAGLETRLNKLTEDANLLEDSIVNKKQAIKESLALIKKYEGQQNNVKNNREYDSLTKEIEFQNLEIQLSEKRIKEFTQEITTKNMIMEASKKTLDERKNDLEIKKAELESIIQETKKEEESLMARSVSAAGIIEDRLLIAYKKIRDNSKNGLAVVGIQRDSCGGCFNKIPPQRQLDIRQRKKIIVCEHCGRILVDAELANKEEVVAQ